MTTSRDKTLEPETQEALDVGSLAPAALETEVSDDPRERAVQAFHTRHRGLKLAPVVVVIPAFNEEDAIRPVLDDVPREACGLAVDTIVIDDGSSDRTAEVARDAGVYVAALDQNSGQGTALRVGYRLARDLGAKYIVTLDADGQWDPADVSRMLEPILADEADFVLGSRVLGRTETDDSVRKAGVRVFAFVVRLLTGAQVTDTSSGVRAFLVEVTDTVRQEEPQYQASELLVGAICQGYRIAERPVVMRKRTAGASKKGHNFLYGLRYGRALVRTWLRDRNVGPVAPAAAAAARNRPAPNPVVHVLSQNWLAAAVLTAGVALRGIMVFAYTPFLWVPTSNGYLTAADAVQPGEAHPWGYSGFLWLTDGLGTREVVVIQHVLVLALAGVLYAFMVHRGVARWLGALAILPLSLSPLLVNIEHHLLPETLFVVLVAAALLVLVWSPVRPSLVSCAVAGVVAAFAGFMQLFGLVMIVPMVVYLICRRVGVVRLGALLVAFAIPLGGYLVWMHQTHGVYAFTTWRGKHLYARVAPFAQCDRLGTLTAAQQSLCDPRPLDARPGPERYLWGDRNAPVRTLSDSVVLGYARKVIAHQPLDYVKAVAGGTAHAFYPGQRQRRREPCVATWGFADSMPPNCPAQGAASAGWRTHPVSVDRTLAHGLNWYARVDYPIGPAFLACVLVTLLALLWRPRAGGWRLRLDAALFGVVGIALMTSAIATSNFNYRYTAILYCTLPIAAALALAHLAAIRRPSERPVPSPA